MRILLAVDDDRPSLLAATAVARWFPGDAQVVALHVLRDPGVIVPMAAGAEAAGYATSTVAELDDEVFEKTALELAGRAATLTDGEARVEWGDPVATICRVAEELAADLIVVGTGDRGFLSRLVHPSIGTDVVTEAPCSVLVVRTPRGDHPGVEAIGDAGAENDGVEEATLMTGVAAVPALDTTSGAMETEAEALRRLQAEGYVRSFRVEPGGRIGDGDVGFDAGSAEVREVVRFEGLSDPDDEAMVLALEGPGGAMGTFAVPYGPAVGVEELEVIRRLDLRGRHRV